MAKAKSPSQPSESLERQLFKAADKLRNNIDAAEYKHVVLGLIFLKYISDSFETVHAQLLSDTYADAEDPDEYLAQNVFFVPAVARWSEIQRRARESEIEISEEGQSKRVNIGGYLDHAMDSIENHAGNEALKGILPRNYGRNNLSSQALAELIDLIGGLALHETAEHSKDILGRIYEYFLGEFAASEGKKGGQFYTPQSIVSLLVHMLEPYQGRVYDPCCGSGGMFVMSEKFVEAHAGRIGDIAIYGQESNHTTWRLCRMNLAIRGIDSSNVRWNNEGSFLRDALPDLRADYVIANPPFNVSDWWSEALAGDARWKFGIPPAGNANYGWLQHILYHLAPTGVAGVVLANGSLSSNTSGEGEIRKNLLEADMVDCVVMLPKQLFYNTGIPACLWFLAKGKAADRYRDRHQEVLFIDASEQGYMLDRTHRAFADEDIERIAGTYHAWREGKGYEDIRGFCKAAQIDEIRQHGYVLTPGRYVGIADAAEDSESFEEKMTALTSQLREQMEEGQKLDAEIRKSLASIGWQI